MTTELQHLHGHFYFAELHTTDVDAACSFYEALFGWTAVETPGAPVRYVEAVDIDGRQKAAMTVLEDEQRAAGVPSHWFAYLTVDDLDVVVDRIAELDGTIVIPPVDVPAGRVAIAVDPTGATVGVWQDLAPATTIKDDHGSPFWYELQTCDIDAALGFYEALIGWKRTANQMGPNMTYYTLDAPAGQDDPAQVPAGGAMQQMQAERDLGTPSAWCVYFNVDDVDATFAQALALGATAVMEPHDIPGIGRSSWLADPQGAVFAAMTPLPRT